MRVNELEGNFRCIVWPTKPIITIIVIKYDNKRGDRSQLELRAISNSYFIIRKRLYFGIRSRRGYFRHILRFLN